MSEETPIGWNGPHGQAHRPVSAARRKLFLEILAATGNFRAAARAATPHSKDAKRPGYSSFYALQNRDPEFAAAVDDALEEAKAAVEEEIRRRGQEGYLEPVYQKGERVYEIDPETGKLMPASVRRFSDVLLLRRAAALMPDRYSERKQIEHSGAVAHVAMQITPQDIAFLSPSQRDYLADILRTLAHARGERDDDANPSTGFVPRMIDVSPLPAARESSPLAVPEPSGKPTHGRAHPRKARESRAKDSPEPWELLG